MKIGEIINEIGFFCLNNGININLTNDEETNIIKITDNEVIINVLDLEDNEFENTLNESLIELKNKIK